MSRFRGKVRSSADSSSIDFELGDTTLRLPSSPSPMLSTMLMSLCNRIHAHIGFSFDGVTTSIIQSVAFKWIVDTFAHLIENHGSLVSPDATQSNEVTSNDTIEAPLIDSNFAMQFYFDLSFISVLISPKNSTGTPFSPKVSIETLIKKTIDSMDPIDFALGRDKIQQNVARYIKSTCTLYSALTGTVVCHRYNFKKKEKN